MCLLLELREPVMFKGGIWQIYYQKDLVRLHRIKTRLGLRGVLTQGRTTPALHPFEIWGIRICVADQGYAVIGVLVEESFL